MRPSLPPATLGFYCSAGGFHRASSDTAADAPRKTSRETLVKYLRSTSYGYDLFITGGNVAHEASAPEGYRGSQGEGLDCSGSRHFPDPCGARRADEKKSESDRAEAGRQERSRQGGEGIIVDTERPHASGRKRSDATQGDGCTGSGTARPTCGPVLLSGQVCRSLCRCPRRERCSRSCGSSS